MEILNNIWSALSTSNEGLIKILLIPLTFLENYFLSNFFISLLKLNTTGKQKLIYVLTISAISVFSMYIFPSPYNVFFNYIVMYLLIFNIFKISKTKSFISVISTILILLIVNSLIMNPYLRILNISYSQIETIPMYRISFILITYLIYFIVTLLLKNIHLKLELIDEFDKRNKFLTHINLIFGLITIGIQVFLIAYYMDNLSIIFSFLNFISVFGYFFISIYSLTRMNKLLLTTKQLESAEEYSKTLTILHDSVRGFKHDYDNTISTIDGYVEVGDIEGFKKFFYQLKADAQMTNNLYTLSPKVINNPGVYSLLTRKYNKADEKNLTITLEFLLDLNELNMKIYEFTKILGILLDNAIEASSESEEKIVNIAFRNEEKRNRQVIIVQNTYADKDVDINKIFTKGVSGKENHTGLGLWEIRNIIKKNNNINLHTTKDSIFFTQQFEIYKK